MPLLSELVAVFLTRPKCEELHASTSTLLVWADLSASCSFCFTLGVPSGRDLQLIAGTTWKLGWPTDLCSSPPKHFATLRSRSLCLFVPSDKEQVKSALPTRF